MVHALYLKKKKKLFWKKDGLAYNDGESFKWITVAPGSGGPKRQC